MKIEIVSPEKAETADAVVCMPWRSTAYFPDDIRGTCCECGQAIRYRPTAPKKLPKVCVPCVLASGDAALQQTQWMMTRRGFHA